MIILVSGCNGSSICQGRTPNKHPKVRYMDINSTSEFVGLILWLIV